MNIRRLGGFMYKYVLQRLLLMIPIVLLVVLIVFFILNVTPGDPGRLILGTGPEVTQEMVDNLNHELGMDRPLLVRYVDYIKNALKLDFGNSYRTGKPVFEAILKSFPTTFKVAVLAVLTSAIIGVPLGIVSAIKRYSFLDMSMTVVAIVLASVPGFWLGIMLILIFSLKLGLLPPSGIGSIKHYIMPVTTLALPSTAYLIRMSRTVMLGVLRQDYIRTAKAKGASRKRIIYKHALRNALLPVVMSLGMNFAGLLGGTIITEMVFGLPGVGSTILAGMNAKDIPIIMAATIFLAILCMVIVLIIDIMYAYIDPRIKAVFNK